MKKKKKIHTNSHEEEVTSPDDNKKLNNIKKHTKKNVEQPEDEEDSNCIDRESIFCDNDLELNRNTTIDDEKQAAEYSPDDSEYDECDIDKDYYFSIEAIKEKVELAEQQCESFFNVISIKNT